MSTAPPRLLELANQLASFLSTDHSFVEDLDEATRHQILDLAVVRSHTEASQSRNRSQRANASDPTPSFPIEWASSRAQLRTALQHFRELVKNQAQSQASSIASASHSQCSTPPASDRPDSNTQVNTMLDRQDQTPQTSLQDRHDTITQSLEADPISQTLPASQQAYTMSSNNG